MMAKRRSSALMLAAADNERRVLELFKRLAKGSKPCMTNIAIARELGITEPQVASALRRLKTKKLVRSESKGHMRRITILGPRGGVKGMTELTDPATIETIASEPSKKNFSKPEPETNLVKLRRCIVGGCGEMFVSQHPGVRICPGCRSRRTSVDLWGDRVFG
jgi:DNA-binding CsgD family transcriptional regulator